MLDQQWETRRLVKRGSAAEKFHKNHHPKTAVAKYGKPNANGQHQINARKLDQDDPDTFKHRKITTEFKKALMQARMLQKLTQSQLAQKIQLKPSTIQDYENGKAIPNGQIIQKLNRALHTKLPTIPKK